MLHKTHLSIRYNLVTLEMPVKCTGNNIILDSSSIACPLIVHSIDCATELVAPNHQTPAFINHKNVLKP